VIRLPPAIVSRGSIPKSVTGIFLPVVTLSARHQVDVGNKFDATFIYTVDLLVFKVAGRLGFLGRGGLNVEIGSMPRWACRANVCLDNSRAAARRGRVGGAAASAIEHGRASGPARVSIVSGSKASGACAGDRGGVEVCLGRDGYDSVGAGAW